MTLLPLYPMNVCAYQCLSRPHTVGWLAAQVKMLQNDAGLWGLDRIDQQDLPYNNLFAPAGDGAGVHVYIIDTGINSAHTEFAGRIGNGADFVDNDANPEDCACPTHCQNATLNL